MDIDYFKILRSTVVQWMEHRMWRARQLLSAAHQQH